MRVTWFAALAIVDGMVWAIYAWLMTKGPAYWQSDPSKSAGSPLDYAAVVLYSAGLCTLASCVWRLRVVRTVAVSFGGAAAALGLGAAGVADLLEDGLGLKPFSLVWGAGILLGTFALIPLGVGLARSKRPLWIAAAALLTVPGLILVMSQWYGALILAGTWLAAGLLHLAGAFPLVRDDIPVSGSRVGAVSV